MNFIDDLKRLQKIHQLISGQNTGSPDNLAASICVSRSELYYILRELKKMGAKISYDRRKRSFCYSNNFKLDVEIKVSYLGEHEMNILGCGYVEVKYMQRCSIQSIYAECHHLIRLAL